MDWVGFEPFLIEGFYQNIPRGDISTKRGFYYKK